MEQLNRFNFWSKKVTDENPEFSNSGCTADQDGSQEDGGGDCNGDGDA